MLFGFTLAAVFLRQDLYYETGIPVVQVTSGLNLGSLVHFSLGYVTTQDVGAGSVPYMR